MADALKKDLQIFSRHKQSTEELDYHIFQNQRCVLLMAMSLLVVFEKLRTFLF